MTRLWNVVSGVACLFMLQGCAIVPGLHIDETDGGTSNQPYRLVDVSALTLAQVRGSWSDSTSGVSDLGSLNPAMVPAEYRIGPGDVLNVTVWEHPELTNANGDFRDPVTAGRLVSAQGTMFYPYVGIIKVEGLTTGQIRDAIVEKLAKVIQRPQIDVRVVAFRAQRVQVSGEVKQPGLVTLDDTPKGVMEAINERGGFTATSSRRRATLIRRGKNYPIELSKLVSGDSPAGNPPLWPGDIVHVPDRSGDQVFILGEVSKQGPAVMEQDRTTLTEALALAGGLDHLRADDGGVLIFRRPPSSELPPTIFRLDLSRPTGLLLAGEFELLPRDVVYVKTTGFAKYNSMINQLLPTISAVFQLDRLIND